MYTCYRPSLNFYKANAKGDGSAMKLELHPAHDNTDGYILMNLANQMTIGNLRADPPIYPSFDWDNAICVKLGFTDLSKMLQVFRGECESLEDGCGLFHCSQSGVTCIELEHRIEPMPGYSLTVGKGGAFTHIFIAPHEALGLTVAIENSLGLVCFGVPKVIEHA